MSSSDEAANAIAALDNKYVWPGMDCPMAVKWMDTQLQQRRRDQHLAAMRHRTVGPMGELPPTHLWSSPCKLCSGCKGAASCIWSAPGVATTLH
jgi:hypothetical protein